MTVRVGAARGAMFPNVLLPSIGGAAVGLERYRGLKNLVVVFTGDASGADRVAPLLRDLVARQEELASETTQVVVVAISRRGIPDIGRTIACPVLLDQDGRSHRSVGATDGSGRTAPAVFVTDRFREIYAAYAWEGTAAWPNGEEVMDWLRFINIQCPECGAPEWPSR